jgi:muconolactone D-isomerase
MDVRIPLDFDGARADELKRVERDRSQTLQKQGKWRRLWRIAGREKSAPVSVKP